MKKLVFTFGLLLTALTLKAQYNYSEWGIGGGYSLMKGYTDVYHNDNSRGYNLNVYYNYSPYLPFSLEAQFGKLSGGSNDTDPYHRYFKNSYFAVIAHGDLQLGDIIDYENSFLLQALKGFYFGTGIGVIRNNITDIRRTDRDNPSYVFPGKNQSLNLVVPLRFGVEIKIFNWQDEPFMAIDLGYVHNITFGEGLDGYNDPSSKFKNNSPDMYRQINVGVKFNFGNPVSYIKSIR